MPFPSLSQSSIRPAASRHKPNHKEILIWLSAATQRQTERCALNQPQPLEAGMAFLADDDAVVHGNAERAGDLVLVPAYGTPWRSEEMDGNWRHLSGTG